MKLGNITKIQTGKLDANAASENGIYPFFTCSKEPLKIDYFKYDCECVLVAGNGDLNVKYYYGKFEAYQRTYIIESSNKNILKTRYLFYFLSKYIETLRNQSIGGVIKFIKLDNLLNAELNIPSLIEQENCILELDKLNQLISLKNNQLKSLDELIKSRFIEMFGDFFNGKSKYHLAKISDVVASKIERASKDFHPDDLIRYVDISSIDNKRNVIIGYTEYTKKEAPSRAQQHVKANDIVVSTVRPNLNNVARIHDSYENIVASSGFCVLRAEKIESDFLFGIVSMQTFADYLNSLTTGANYPAVSDKDILNFMIPYPPNDKQQEYAEFVKQVDKSKFIVQKQIEDLQELLDSKMDEYFG